MTDYSAVVCCDGRLVRKIPTEVLFKYVIEDINVTFRSVKDNAQEAYDEYLKWIMAYRTPDGYIIHRCFTLSEMNKYIVQETGEAFFSNHRNIYKAYTDPDKNLFQFLHGEQLKPNPTVT